MVSIGYGSPAAVRFHHPSGFTERLVHNLRELEGVDPKKEAVRIAGSVGSRKRIAIINKADELEIRVLNRNIRERIAEEEEKEAKKGGKEEKKESKEQRKEKKEEKKEKREETKEKEDSKKERPSEKKTSKKEGREGGKH